MGGQPCKQERQPWRTINWGENTTVLQRVKEYSPQTEGQQLRVLLIGPVGAGKSSFINSVQSVLLGRSGVQALVGEDEHSFTKKYTTYKVQKEDRQSFYPFVFNDTMGLAQQGGVLVEDIKLALKGHVKDGYTFNPESRLSEDSGFYNRAPTANDRVHVLVFVIPARLVFLPMDCIMHKQSDENMNNLQQYKNILPKFQVIRREASDLGIPQVGIITKIDELHHGINTDLHNTYKSLYLHMKMDMFSMESDIPKNCIFPVKNYTSETSLDEKVDSLILNALENIINFGDDNINLRKSSERLVNF